MKITQAEEVLFKAISKEFDNAGDIQKEDFVNLLDDTITDESRMARSFMEGCKNIAEIFWDAAIRNSDKNIRPELVVTKEAFTADFFDKKDEK